MTTRVRTRSLTIFEAVVQEEVQVCDTCFGYVIECLGVWPGHPWPIVQNETARWRTRSKAVPRWLFVTPVNSFAIQYRLRGVRRLNISNLLFSRIPIVQNNRINVQGSSYAFYTRLPSSREADMVTSATTIPSLG